VFTDYPFPNEDIEASAVFFHMYSNNRDLDY